MALPQPLLCFITLLVRRKGLDINGQAFDQLRGDDIERAAAANLEDGGIEVFLCLPCKLQGERGLASAGLAVKEQDRRLGGKRVAQMGELCRAADEVLRAVVGKIDGGFESTKALRALAAVEPIKSVAMAACGSLWALT